MAFNTCLARIVNAIAHKPLHTQQRSNMFGAVSKSFLRVRSLGERRKLPQSAPKGLGVLPSTC
eukprot:11030736-Alexandrium_andersonii.AAC.1